MAFRKKKRAGHNSIKYINPVYDSNKFRRTIQKRGRGLLKKTMELSILTGAKVFLSIEIFDAIVGTDTILTHTTRHDRNYKKQLDKILHPKKDILRLDTQRMDYFKIFKPYERQTIPPHPRDIKHPWFWEKSTAKILLPQLLKQRELNSLSNGNGNGNGNGNRTGSGSGIGDVLEMGQNEVVRYFGTDKHDLFDSRIADYPDKDEQKEVDAIVYDKKHFKFERLPCFLAIQKRTDIRQESWQTIFELRKTLGL